MTLSNGQRPTRRFRVSRDPYPWYQTMRASTPVRYDPENHCWNVFRFDDVQRVLQDYRSFSSSFVDPSSTGPRDPMDASMIAMDPPRHNQMRALVSKAFTPKAIADLAPRITTIATDLLDRVTNDGRLDVVADLACPLPVTVIAELLGIPTEDRERFKQWSDVLVGGAEAFEQSPDVYQELGEYFQRVVDQRRQEPKRDLISALLQAELDGERLSTLELLGFCVLLLVAGNETTTNLIGNAVVCFCEDPEILPGLRAAPELLPGAIEEVLRYRSPVQALPNRFARLDTDLGGQPIKAGDHVIFWIGSANRDESKFPDASRFILDRTPNPHLAFGAGVHFCLGAPLARLEARIALSTLIARCPNLEIAESEIEIVSSEIVYGPKRLNVRFDE